MEKSNKILKIVDQKSARLKACFLESTDHDHIQYKG